MRLNWRKGLCAGAKYLGTATARAHRISTKRFDEATRRYDGAPIISDSAPDLIALLRSAHRPQKPPLRPYRKRRQSLLFAEEFFGRLKTYGLERLHPQCLAGPL